MFSLPLSAPASSGSAVGNVGAVSGRVVLVGLALSIVCVSTLSIIGCGVSTRRGVSMMFGGVSTLEGWGLVGLALSIGGVSMMFVPPDPQLQSRNKGVFL